MMKMKQENNNDKITIQAGGGAESVLADDAMTTSMFDWKNDKS